MWLMIDILTQNNYFLALFTRVTDYSGRHSFRLRSLIESEPRSLTVRLEKKISNDLIINFFLIKWIFHISCGLTTSRPVLFAMFTSDLSTVLITLLCHPLKELPILSADLNTASSSSQTHLNQLESRPPKVLNQIVTKINY